MTGVTVILTGVTLGKTMKKSDLKRFEEAFVFYFCRKRPNGKREFKEDTNYVKQLAAAYYQQVAGNVFPSDYGRFFDWLATEEVYFVDEHKFRLRVNDWSRRRKEIKADIEIDEEFLQYVLRYACLADTVHLKEACGIGDCLYRRVSILCDNINVHPLKNSFIGKTKAECFQAFFTLLHDRGVTADVIDRMEKEMRAADDELAEARASGSVPNYFLKKMDPSTRGVVLRAMGYEPKRQKQDVLERQQP